MVPESTIWDNRFGYKPTWYPKCGWQGELCADSIKQSKQAAGVKPYLRFLYRVTQEHFTCCSYERFSLSLAMVDPWQHPRQYRIDHGHRWWPRHVQVKLGQAFETTGPSHRTRFCHFHSRQ